MKKNIPQQTNELEMMMLPISERTLTFGNELMLADNFNLPPIEEREIEVHLTPACPFKVMFTMIMICTRGYMRFRYNLQEYTLKAGTILIIQPNSFGECLEISKDFQVAYISYKDESYIEENSASILSQFRNKMTQQAVINVSEEKMNELLTIYRTIRKTDTGPYTEFTREALKGYMRVILADTYQELAKMMETNGTDYKKSRSKYLFEKFLNLVQQCYTKERSVTFYAETMYLTPKYLSQVIYQASGRHAGEWIKDYVILEAKILLKSGKYTVQQVGDMLNFANASFFRKILQGCNRMFAQAIPERTSMTGTRQTASLPHIGTGLQPARITCLRQSRSIYAI